MDNLSVARIDSHMAGVADDIARLHLIHTDAVADAPVCPGRVGKRYPELLIYAHDEAGAVSSVRQGCSAIYIRIADELGCISDNCASAGPRRSRIGLAA